jgi:hypothetical protein
MYAGVLMSGLSQLYEQERALLPLAQDGVKAAQRRLAHVRNQIHLVSEMLGIVDSSLVFTKPGYNSKMIRTLAVQASMGSDVCILELQKLANWVISMNAQKMSRSSKVPYSNTGTLCHGWHYSRYGESGTFSHGWEKGKN